MTASTPNQPVSGYAQTILDWRAKREAALRAPDGWLTLTNLHMLADGAHSIGSDPSCAIALPAGAPARLGVLHFSNGAATLRVETDAPVQANGERVPQGDALNLVDNAAGSPTMVTCGTTTFFIHCNGDARAVRVRDSAHPNREKFAGCAWYAVDPAYRASGRLARFDQPRATAIATITNNDETFQAAGELEFELDGAPQRLLALSIGKPDSFFVIFRDATSGKTSYAPARFLMVSVDQNDNADIDFNMAFNPPCAFTPYATCPLPPPQNVLRIAIEAGERKARE